MAEKKPTDAGRKPVLMTLQQGSAYSGVPYTSLRKLMHDGYLPRVRLGDSKRDWVKSADLDRLITASTETLDR